MVGRCCCLRLASVTFITRVGFSTSTLAYVLDSLVRVSRRVGKNHFSKIAQGFLRRCAHQQRGRGEPRPQTFVGAAPHFALQLRIRLSLPHVVPAALAVLTSTNG
jgi:hypothetical protein